MAALPTVRPISDLRIRQAEVLAELSEGPVILANRGHAAAVLVSLDMWNRLIERMEDAEDALDLIEARRISQGFVDFDDSLTKQASHVSASA